MSKKIICTNNIKSNKWNFNISKIAHCAKINPSKTLEVTSFDNTNSNELQQTCFVGIA